MIKKDYHIALRFLKHLKQITYSNQRINVRWSADYEDLRKYYEKGFIEHIKRYDVPTNEELESKFKEELFKHSKITNIKLTRLIRNGYKGAIRNKMDSEEVFVNKFGATRDELRKHYYEFELRDFKKEIKRLLTK